MQGEHQQAALLAPGIADIWRGLAQLSITLDDVEHLLGNVVASGEMMPGEAPFEEKGAWLRAYA